MIKALFLTAMVAATASAAELLKAAGGKHIRGQYIVRLRDSESVESLRSHIARMREALGMDELEPLHVYENMVNYKNVGYAAKLSERALTRLLEEDIVSFIEEDREVTIGDCQEQSNPVWGLARTNHRDYNASATYTYDYTTGATGKGVDAYVIDTGIYCENNDFVNKKVGSCTFGYSSVTNIIGVVDTTDGNGHGTHVSGTIAGQTYGVAKEADLIAVKVMSDRGSGSSSNILSGIDWVIGNAKKTKKPSVANLSIGGGFSQTENDAITSATEAGITMVVAAGNDDSDACEYSPASAPAAITVGATGDDNARAYYSNYGSCLDVFGPGTDITSTWIDSPDATNTISGTSMASPHVCGVAAKILSANPSFSVEQVTQKLLKDATPGVVSDVQGSPNLMVYATCN
mmetsp:Transcript_1759/g.2758  ORF Transcript_1759/g.2758 Transcript_1759/m.2758 type:complete len:404 (+) Transcript_1759:59-1270(+)|eukprot:CAMPEP_0185017830 /NCGR_PEP_ID=MMETSP1103-20130426/708_1 /TAXON_ID=36769 /ORGANISM="Paraphysomonas bandaiensis, Strain Caron Lab Isolate" /LENGTH=403 /DNA_ID=CAMNT_0027547413 /DNA_START=44 /DNA_END=1255 /DNA_ORIENTATION=-